LNEKCAGYAGSRKDHVMKKCVKMCMKGLVHVSDIVHRRCCSWSERHCPEYDAILLMDLLGEGLVQEVSLLRAV
jgi:hypothetical protein